MSESSGLFGRRRLVGAALALLGLSVTAAVLSSAMHSRALTRVSARAVEGTKEARDGGLLSLATGHSLPDHACVVVERSGKEHRLGVVADTSAAKTIHWDVERVVNVEHVASIRLLEVDAVSSDVLAEATAPDFDASAAGYEITVTTRRSAAAAVAWFAGTRVGTALLIVLGAMTLVAVLYALSG